jgi:hypothetical protein
MLLSSSCRAPKGSVFGGQVLSLQFVTHFFSSPPVDTLSSIQGLFITQLFSGTAAPMFNVDVTGESRVQS